MSNIDWITEALSTAFLQDEDEKNVASVTQAMPIINANHGLNCKESRDWIEQARVLERRRGIHELESRAVTKQLKAMVSTNDDISDFESFRKSQLSQLALVMQKVKAVRAQVASSQGSKQAVNDLAMNIDEADAALGEMKRSQALAFRTLMAQEQRLDAELEDAAHHIALSEQKERRPSYGAWMQQGRVKVDQEAREEVGRDVASDDEGEDRDQHQKIVGQRRPLRNNGCLAPEVAEFDDFVERSGGDSGGWDKDDHEEFTKIVKACNGDYLQAIAVCQERTIGYTHAEIVSHASWHMDYLDLLVRKRTALARWREEKQKAKAAVIASAALLGCDSAAAAREERAVAGRSSAATSHEQQVQREMVLKWKAQKEEELRMKEAERLEAVKRMQERRRIEIDERQLVNKMKIEAHRDAKDRADKIKQMRSEIQAIAKSSADQKTSVDHMKAWRVEERNNSYLRRRHSLIAQKEEQKVVRQEVQARLLDKVRVEAPSDPNRLLKGTSSHMNRTQENREGAKKEPAMSGFILRVPHLGKSSWMGK